MEIRTFKDEDAKPVSTLIEECFYSLDLGGHTEEGKRLQVEANRPENLIKRAETVRYFITHEKNLIIGICGYDKYKIQTLFVDVSHQNKGIGKKLMDAIMNHPELQNLQRWGLATNDAHDLYKKYGFKRISQPDILMEIINKPS